LSGKPSVKCNVPNGESILSGTGTLGGIAVVILYGVFDGDIELAGA